MTTFTPGPWKVYSQYGEIGNITNSDGSIVVAQAQQVEPRSHDVRLANTHLIAAAPELLEALEALDNYVSNNLTTEYPTGIDINAAPFEAARTAIAKARGSQ